jgi:hypothetical protein
MFSKTKIKWHLQVTIEIVFGFRIYFLAFDMVL